ncbi:hypothetical protein COBT_000247 [Conglomerata obtusa]
MLINLVQHYQSCCDGVLPERFVYEKIITQPFKTILQEKTTMEKELTIIDNCSQNDEVFALLSKITKALMCNYNFKNDVKFFVFAFKFDSIEESNIWNKMLKNCKFTHRLYERCKDQLLFKNFSLNDFLLKIQKNTFCIHVSLRQKAKKKNYQLHLKIQKIYFIAVVMHIKIHFI